MKVGYIKKRKNEVYICPSCGKIYFAKEPSRLKRWWLNHFCHEMQVYDDKQLRLYWFGDVGMVIGDTTGEEIAQIEREKWEETKRRIEE